MSLRWFCLVLLMCGAAQASEPAYDQLTPILPTPFAWQLSAHEGVQTLQVIDSRNHNTLASYDISECLFCSGEEENCDLDGVFGYANRSVPGPLLGVVCHKGAHSQRFMLFRPLVDAYEPVMRATGAYSIRLLVEPEGIAVAEDGYDPDYRAEAYWPGGFKPQRPVPQAAKPLLRPVLSTRAVQLEQELRAVLEGRDIAALEKLLAPDVEIDLGERVWRGKDAFIDFWQPQASFELWDWLSRLIRVGGVESLGGRRFVYPSIVTVGEAGLRAAVAQESAVHVAPDRSSPVVERLSPQWLQPAPDILDGLQELEGWSAVRTPNGYYGFISHQDSLLPDEDGLELRFIDGRWQITRLWVREH